MNRESRFSGVAPFLLPERPELLSIDDDRELPFDLPVTTGDRADGEESLELAFFNVMLLPLLSSDEVTLFEEEETEDVDLIKDLLTVSCLITSDSVDVLKLLLIGVAGPDFLASETPARGEALVTAEGNELLLISGRESLNGSEANVVVFLAATELTLPWRLVTETDGFSGKPPVLFLLIETTFELRADPDPPALDFAMPKLESEFTFDSIFFRTEPVGPKDLEAAAALLGFTVLETLFALSDELRRVFLSGSWGFSGGLSPDCTTRSSILV